MEVHEDPYFDIPIEIYIWPILHTLIGVGNAILTNLINTMENEIQVLPPREIRVQLEAIELLAELRALNEEKDEWDSENEESGSMEIKEHKKEVKRLEKKIKSMDEYGNYDDEDEEYTID